MPNYQTDLLILKKTKLAETDLIVTALSVEGRQVRAVVKGGRKPGSRLGAHLELYSEAQVVLYQGRSLDTVTEARLINAHQELRQDLEHAAAAATLTELLENISRDADAEPRLYALSSAALSCIGNTLTTGLELVVAAALLKVVAQIGFMPSLSDCVICGRQPAKRSYFSFEQGGLVCSDCQAELVELVERAEPVDRGLTAVDNSLLNWINLVIHSRFAELGNYTGAEYRRIGQLLLAFAGDWIRVQIMPVSRSLDFFRSLR